MDGMDAPYTFGEWVKRRRKALDLTQGELANRAGCSVSALRKIELGERRGISNPPGRAGIQVTRSQDGERAVVMGQALAQQDLLYFRLGKHNQAHLPRNPSTGNGSRGNPLSTGCIR